MFLLKISVFPDIVNSCIECMRQGLQKEYTLPKILAEKLCKQLEDFLRTKSYLNKGINLQKNQTLKKSLGYDFNKKIQPIFENETNKIISFLKNEYIPNCRTSIGMSSLPNGKKEYNFLVNSTLTLKNTSVDNIHKFGLLEVDRIYKRMENIKKQMSFNGSLKSFYKYLKNKPELQYKSKNELLKTYKNYVSYLEENILPNLFYNMVKSKCLVESVPKYNEDYSAEAYYMPGDIENKRPGKFSINLKNIKNNSKMELESLTLHEAIPGHHFQQTYVNESKSIPLFMKIYGSDAYVEGWALYCENLGEYKTPESYFGKLILEMIRALRLVVDTGIHYYGWSYKKTFNYYSKYSFDPPNMVESQILRYTAIPHKHCHIKRVKKYLKMFA